MSHTSVTIDIDPQLYWIIAGKVRSAAALPGGGRRRRPASPPSFLLLRDSPLNGLTTLFLSVLHIPSKALL